MCAAHSDDNPISALWIHHVFFSCSSHIQISSTKLFLHQSVQKLHLIIFWHCSKDAAMHLGIHSVWKIGRSSYILRSMISQYFWRESMLFTSWPLKEDLVVRKSQILNFPSLFCHKKVDAKEHIVPTLDALLNSLHWYWHSQISKGHFSSVQFLALCLLVPLMSAN